VPNPSEVVRSAVGTASVCEAAALLVAGPGAELLVTKSSSTTSTVAIAIRAHPAGHLQVIGLGPGAARHRTPAATVALREAEVVIGYAPYLEAARDAIGPTAEVVSSPIGEEVQRCSTALSAAASGRRVALVCSGDAGIYALATLVFELAPQHPSLDPLVDIEVVPGVTAAVTSAALLGAPLGHDHAAISLSDLLTPWPVIADRLSAAAASDLVVSLYNPRSAGREWQLAAALELLGDRRPPSTPVGIVTDGGRLGEQVTLTTLGDLNPTTVGMTSCVIVGASTTRVVGGRMVTPRGYQP
jgi:cobalt-precorrin 5A hydrolase/precorrin-3B C17-methyltransferase